MSSVINTNVTAIRTQNVYNRNNDYMADAMRKVATGMKINSAKDNSSVWAITEKMKERIRANDQANQNIQNDTALLRTAQDGMGNTLDILKTLKERAINAANDSNVTDDRTKIAEEVKQLALQIDDNAAKVKFNGRQLLNGGQEATNNKVISSTGTLSPETVTASGTYADKAIYGITGLSLGSSTTVNSSTKLVDLVGDNGQTLFHSGDTLTFNWTDNGVEKQSQLTIKSDTKLQNLSSTGFTTPWVKKGDQIESVTYSENGGKVNAAADGLYLLGAANHNISNLSISVTTDKGVTRAAAQEALTPTAVTQSIGDTSKGSNAVFSATVSFGYADSATAGDLTQLYQLGSAAASADKASSTYDIQINDVKMTFKGSNTLKDISDAFKEKGINVELHFTKSAKDALTYEGNTVTKGTYGSTVSYDGTAEKGLHFVAGENQEISNISIVGSGTASEFKAANKFNNTSSGGLILQKLFLDDTTTGGSTSSSSSMLPQGGPLQFFVGGEQNFGVNFTIGKATVANLLGSNANTFASKFLTKEGAESAISVIDNAISKTLTEQTRLGAMEARLGYTSDNIVSMNENLDAGVSSYRDTDMAKEMTNYMKYSVLSQASQYMLSQASQNAFSVLNLLQS